MATTVFLVVAVAATLIFFVQFVFSLFFGDWDLEADLDADMGSLLSFKGLTHFCIGMGWYMYLSKGASVGAYAVGMVVGLVFVAVLWFLYKKAYQLQKENKRERPEALLGRECIIYAKNENRYIVQVAINGALREIDVCSLSGQPYRTGDKTTICRVEAGILYIQ